MRLFHTTEGVYLTENKATRYLPITKIGLNVEKHLMLADSDLNAYELYMIIN